MIKRSYLLIVALVLMVSFFANAEEQQKREFRAVWFTTVANIDWPISVGSTAEITAAQQQEMIDYLDRFERANLNVVCFQVRSMSDAMYKSSYEPWSSFLTGQRGVAPQYDPLEFIVAQCHKRGMELHCWLNPYRFANDTPDAWNTPQDLELKANGMLISYTDAQGDTRTYWNPALPATRERIMNVCRELITNYNIDGIIFDDYFYPHGIPATADQPDYPLYAASGSTRSFADWRREQVNTMVKDVYDMIQSLKPQVRFGIGPAGVAGTEKTSAARHGIIPCPNGTDWQYSAIFSDPVEWLAQGTIDYISPQLYWKTDHKTNAFGPLTDWWGYCAARYSRHHYASQNIYFLEKSNTENDWEEVASQIRLSRQSSRNNAPGFNFFSAKYIDGPACGGLGGYLRENVLQSKAIPPAISWKNAVNPGTPQNVSLGNGTLTWSKIDAPLVKYAIYAIPYTIALNQAFSTEFSGIKSDWLVAITYDNSIVVPDDKRHGYRYAITVLDGYNNEYQPVIISP